VPAEIFHSVDWYRALNVTERIDGGLDGLHDRQPSNRIDADLGRRRLEAWGLGDVSAVYGCTKDEFEAAVGESVKSIRSRMPPPGWLATLEKAFAGNQPSPQRLSALRCLGGPEAPFVRIANPAIRKARRRLRDRVRSLEQKHPNSSINLRGAHDLLLPSLGQSLAMMLTPAAVLEMHAAAARNTLPGDSAEERFYSFLEVLATRESTLELLQRYPVLGRLVATSIEIWEEAAFELVQRLVEDWNLICGAYEQVTHNDALVAVQPLGDRHRRGRVVTKLIFESGFQIIYKPRSLDVEARFQELLAWLNARADFDAPLFPIRKYLRRGVYGWVEVVERRACTDREQVRRFYQRQGGYLALLHALAGSDFHFENIIAAGEDPILIDLETLFHSTERTPQPGDETLPGMAKGEGASLLRVGMLPQDLIGDGSGLDPSGLGQGGQLTPLRVPKWVNPSTDAMHRVLARAILPPGAHRPLVGSSEASATDFISDLEAGFRMTYQTIYKHRRALLAVDGPINKFGDAETRHVLRPTVQYGLLLDSSFHPHLLADAASRDRHFDQILGESKGWHGSARIVAAERRDLWAGDVPVFTTRPATTDLWTSDGAHIPNVLSQPGLGIVRHRIAGFSSADRERHCWMIRTAMQVSTLNTLEGLPYPNPTNLESHDLPSSDRFLDAARLVGDRLDELAFRDDGGAIWFGVKSLKGKRWKVDPAGPHLYDGLGGIALFLSYLASFENGDPYEELARAALTTVRRQLQDTPDTMIGGFSGYGGIIHILTHLGVIHRDDSLIDEALRLVTPLVDLIPGDLSLDVLAGSAGAIVPLLNLARVTGSAVPVAAARSCGNHLLENSVVPDGGVGIGWLGPAATSAPLSGFAHGVAGISWALLELYGISEDDRYRDAAVAAIAYERTTYSSVAKNWRDLRELSPSSGDTASTNGSSSGGTAHAGHYMSHWCHGSAGIGLARTRVRRHWTDDLLDAEIRAAARATCQSGLGFNHSLCHGDLGNVEALLEASTCIEEPEDWVAAAESVAAQACQAVIRGDWITGYPLALEVPGLMMGLAGIGYGLLKVGFPAMPSVLLLDSPPASELVSRRSPASASCGD
jgi:type 2 lantibiotic biosynthesis protein LanM